MERKSPDVQTVGDWGKETTYKFLPVTDLIEINKILLEAMRSSINIENFDTLKNLPVFQQHKNILLKLHNEIDNRTSFKPLTLKEKKDDGDLLSFEDLCELCRLFIKKMAVAVRINKEHEDRLIYNDDFKTSNKLLIKLCKEMEDRINAIKEQN